MPRPPLPAELRKDVAIKVRFLESEVTILLKQAKLHNCKTVSQYIRKLVREDIIRNKKGANFPEIW